MNIEKKLKRAGRRALTAAIGGVAAAALALGGLFSSADELMDAQEIAPPAIVQLAQESPADTAYTPDTEEKRRRSLKERIKEWIIGLPDAVKVLFVLPLWCGGRVIVWLLTALFEAISPLAGALGGLLFNLLLIAGMAMLTYKLMFPNKPLKELFKGRNLLIMGACALTLTAADAVLPIFVEKYETYAHAVKVGLTLLIPAGLMLTLAVRKYKRAAQAG